MSEIVLFSKIKTMKDKLYATMINYFEELKLILKLSSF